jgi:hypothetical protein
MPDLVEIGDVDDEPGLAVACHYLATGVHRFVRPHERVLFGTARRIGDRHLAFAQRLPEPVEEIGNMRKFAVFRDPRQRDAARPQGLRQTARKAAGRKKDARGRHLW